MLYVYTYTIIHASMKPSSYTCKQRIKHYSSSDTVININQKMLQSRKKKTAGAPSWMKKNTTKSDLSAITTWIFFGCRKESIVSSHTNLWAETDGAISTSTFTSFVPRNVGGQNHVDPKKTEFATLQGINISHQTGKGKSSSKCHFWGDMLVPWRVFPGQLDISINISKKKMFRNKTRRVAAG